MSDCYNSAVDLEGAIDVALPGAHVRFTSRLGGVSAAPYAALNLGAWSGDDAAAVAENRRRAADGRPVAFTRQVHGTRVIVVGNTGAAGGFPDDGAVFPPAGAVGDAAGGFPDDGAVFPPAGPGAGAGAAAAGGFPDDGAVFPPAGAEEADGLATAAGALALMVVTADCLPVALATPNAVAMVHAGWRGLADGVLEEGVAALRGLDPDGELRAVIGPGAGGCCYEVGDDVAARFPGAPRDGRRIDLKAVATQRLRDAGAADVTDVGACTMCAPERFFSHRAGGGERGRQGGLIWRTPDA